MSTSSVPAGYRQLDRNSQFSDLTGPYYGKQQADGEPFTLCLRIEEKHINNLGVVHGGALMTLADNAVGDAVEEALDEPAAIVTVSMNSEFLNPAKLGDWVEAQARVLKKGGRLMFVDCLLSAGGKPILHASAVMARVNRKK